MNNIEVIKLINEILNDRRNRVDSKASINMIDYEKAKLFASAFRLSILKQAFAQHLLNKNNIASMADIGVQLTSNDNKGGDEANDDIDLF